MSVKWGIIGCGDVAQKKSLPSFVNTENTELVALADINTDRAEEVARRFNIKHVYSNYEEMLSHSEIQAVYIATPPFLHHQQSIAALRRNKHVLCEKPMALNLKQCKEMVYQAEKNNVILMVSYYRRFWPQIQIIKQLIDTGEIGDIVNVRTQMTGNVELEPEHIRKWKLDRNLSGGGMLIDVGCHRVDLLLYLIGSVVDVTACVENTWNHEVENAVNFILRFENGALGTGAYNWNVGFYSDDLEIIGTTGKIVASPLGAEKIVLKRHRQSDEIETPKPEYTHTAIISLMNQAIQNKTMPNGTVGKSAVRVNEIIEAAYLSSSQRRTINLKKLE